MNTSKQDLNRFALTTLIIAGFISSIVAGVLPISWTHSFGGNGWDGAYTAKQTYDGGYIILGHIDTSVAKNNRDCWLLRTNSSGDTIWTRIFGGHGDDEGYSVLQTEDSGFILTGSYRKDSAGTTDLRILRTRSNGDTVWSRIFGGTHSEAGSSLIKASDSNYLVVGYKYSTSFGSGNSDLWLLCFNSSGDTLWSRTYGHPSSDYGCCIQRASNDGYVILGRTVSFGRSDYDYWLIRINNQGDSLWTKTYNSGYDDIAEKVVQTADHGFALFGMRRLEDNSEKWWLVRTDSLGDSLWSKSYSGDEGTDLLYTPDSGFILVGGNGGSGLLIRTNALGDSLWSESLSGTSMDFIWSCSWTSDSGIILSGGTMNSRLDNGNVVITKIGNYRPTSGVRNRSFSYSNTTYTNTKKQNTLLKTNSTTKSLNTIISRTCNLLGQTTALSETKNKSGRLPTGIYIVSPPKKTD